MSTSIAAPSFAARKPCKSSKRSPKRSSRKAISPNLFGAAAVGCLVLGCGWTVYTNIIAASVYPTLGSTSYDEPMIKHAPRIGARIPSEAIEQVFAALPDERPLANAPAGPITATLFAERFAASEAQSVPSNAASAAPPVAVAEAAKPAGPSRPGEVSKMAEAAKSDTSKFTAAKSKQAPAAPTQLALNTPAPSEPETRRSAGVSIRDMAERAKAAVMSIASGEKASMVEKLWGKQPSTSTVLAYASADADVTASIGQNQNPMHGGSPPYDRSTAVYDISRKTVYLPDGTKLEAHSGLGSNLDDPRSAHLRMRGVTPPHIYEMKPREALFHGVPALRLTPIGGEDAIFGRDGLLAHTYMLGPNGDSNGCVSFKDYYAFLDAYRNKGIRKLAVLASID
ncbi:MAG: DUF2778 domain-containing protein [Bradyrhizobium sp.]|uniref:DUF2778 domain-containing protein n=1 Tax=Bradyrhizobium sp. TaxID=376 RepID=UPI0025C2D5E6|nr:DUF2778 domain-containing protein [Bradyrhizobium sp.]MBI5262466.1 DUF2778 domain-containing protein [Bradyrhizobium sp.]